MTTFTAENSGGSEFAVELREVIKRFPNPGGGVVHAVDRVTLQFRHGEFFSLLGPSGCGKTTSLRMIAGFEVPDEGEIIIQGKPMSRTPPYQRPVNTVFQSYALFQHMSIANNVAFGLEMEGLPKKLISKRVEEILELVKLGGLGARRPRQLSGGQQQRVALARALVKFPTVLLLDEPLGALDLKLRKEMQVELKALQEKVGITFIYVTHDQEEALTMSDRIAVMNKGKVLQIGRPVEIYERPSSRFVADFIGETNFLPGVILGVNGGTATVALQDLNCEVTGLRQGDLRPGQRAVVSVRPEKIRLSHERNESGNVLAGRVVNSIYIGSDTRVVLDLGGGRQLNVWEQNKTSTLDEQAYYLAGQELWMSMIPENALVLEEE
jgi:spermidine/putrescine transport system ATP-binding protein